ncbi:MAG: hypothetical protein NUV68_04860 [Caldiserica bacterium]|jgi:hypothetical protein|nr:hypothetical protein [Caldisericota bacterium]MDH7562662.1 hypothetical protein [Caldisericota bacterium]
MVTLPEKLRELLEEYAQRSGRPELRECSTLEEYRRLFPVQDKIPALIFPEERRDFFLLSEVKGELRVPWKEEWLKETLEPFSLWLNSSRLEGKILSLESLHLPGSLDWEGVPVFFYLGKMLQEVGDPVFQKDFPDEEQAFQFGLQNIEEAEALIGDAARVLRFLRFLKGKLRREVRRLRIRTLFLTGYPEIPTIFAFQAKGILPRVEVREFYSSPLGVLGVQRGEKPGINLVDTAFIEWKTRKEIKLPFQVKKGEYGKLIVSTRQVPRFALPETFLSLGDGVFKNEGAEERYPLWRFWLQKT